MSVIHWTERTELVKDPVDEIYKHFSYERWLVSPALLDTSEWVITGPDSALMFDNDTITNGGLYATLRLKGGTDGESYELTNTITTTETPPQTLKRSITVTVRAQ
jgi:hypothetical protein